MKKTISTLILSLAVNSAIATEVPSKDSTEIKNVIMIVADGMSPAFTSAYRYYADNPNTPEIETSIFDRYLVGMSSTYPAAESGLVTDSAAGATALATGVKSYNGAISVNVNKKPVETVLQRAKSIGKKTGVVVTSQVNHATPAAYITHNESRQNYNEIADSYIDNGINIDVLMGGGWKYFIREDRNLVEEFKKSGFTYVDHFEQLDTIEKQSKVLGLFASVGLTAAIDDTERGRLTEMTLAAIKQLENPNGYFLLIEASQVDWAAHSNDINSAMAEMRDLAKTLSHIEQYVKSNPNTQVILTADHGTGGLALAANGEYRWSPELIRKMTQSTYQLASQLVEGKVTIETLSKGLAGSSITEEELASIVLEKQNALNELAVYKSLSKEIQKKQRKPNVQKHIYLALNKLIDKKTNTGWTTGGHTAIDVPVIAIGSASDTFSGLQDNTDIAKGIFQLIGK